MAAPKKCKSLTKRKIAHGHKMKSPKARGFNGFCLNVYNLKKCDKCSRVIKSHFHCYQCTIKEIKPYFNL